MCKLFEKIINYRLSWFLEKTNFFSPKQNGFKKNRCTMDSLYEINEEIKQTFAKKQLMGVINLDIAKAYDTTWRHNIIIKFDSIPRQTIKYNNQLYFKSQISSKG